MVKLLERFRDRVIHRSQIGKRRLDAAFTRRELDRKWLELGERYSDLAREGQVAVPAELAKLIEEIRQLERRLAQQRQDVADLTQETARET